MRDLIWFEGVDAFTLFGSGAEGLLLDGGLGESTTVRCVSR